MSTISLDAAGRVRDLFFEAAVNTITWERALGALTDLFDAHGSTLLIVDKELIRPVAGWVAGKFDPAGMQPYLTYYSRLDPAVSVLPALPVGQLYSYKELVNDAIVRRSEFFQDFLIPLGGRHLTSGKIFDDVKEFATLAVQTSTKRGAFSAQEDALLQALWPSLVTAMQVFRRLSAATIDSDVARVRGMLDAFERMAFGGMLIDPFARVLHMNAQAERHLGDAIRLDKGRLVARHRESDAKLQKLLANVISNPVSLLAQGAVTIARPHRRPLLAHVMPTTGFEKLGVKSRAAIVLLIDPDVERPVSERALSQIFGLTTAEIKLAQRIAGGLSPKEAADELRVSYETARTQLKAIFQKTGVHRQSELVALLGRLGAIAGE